MIGIGQLGSDLMKTFDEAIPLTHDDIDVTDSTSCEMLKKIKPDLIINTAAFHRTDECEERPEESFLVNSIGARNIARISRDIGATNIFISTDYVFDGEKGSSYTEKDAPRPVNTYGISKYSGEFFTRYLSGKYYVFRVASLFGASGARGKGGNFVETMLSKARGGNELNVVDDIVMSPTYTKDIATVTRDMVKGDLPSGIYHVTNEGSCTWYDFAKAIFELTGVSASLNPTTSDKYPTKAIRPKNSSLSVEKIRSYGINMRPWRAALKAYLNEKKYISLDD